MGRLHTLKIFRQRRKDLRNNATSAEKRLWYFLKGKQLAGRKFTRQHSIGKYIVDFYCSEEQLIIELDGEHHKEEEQVKYDEARTKYLESLNKRVIRFSNMDVLIDTDKVLKEIERNFRDK
jgi:very-short-patch-repair endonuclease